MKSYLLISPILLLLLTACHHEPIRGIDTERDNEWIGALILKDESKDFYKAGDLYANKDDSGKYDFSTRLNLGEYPEEYLTIDNVDLNKKGRQRIYTFHTALRRDDSCYANITASAFGALVFYDSNINYIEVSNYEPASGAANGIISLTLLRITQPGQEPTESDTLKYITGKFFLVPEMDFE